MLTTFPEQVYDSLCDNLVESARIPGVENLFADNSACQAAYEQMLEAYDRLCLRLNTNGEDPDVEIILTQMRRIQKITAMKMYEYGKKFGLLKDGEKLLVIKDSFAHSLVPFLADHYSEITMLDMRYYKQNVSELIEQGDFDRMLFIYSVDNLGTDTDIAWLE